MKSRHEVSEALPAILGHGRQRPVCAAGGVVHNATRSALAPATAGAISAGAAVCAGVAGRGDVDLGDVPGASGARCDAVVDRGSSFPRAGPRLPLAGRRLWLTLPPSPSRPPLPASLTSPTAPSLATPLTPP